MPIRGSYEERFCLSAKVLPLFEKFPLEEQHVEHADGDVAVGQVENRAEEQKRIAADSRYPRRIGAPEQREKQHVDHSPVQKSGIASSFGQERRRGGERRFREKQAVERAVDHIAERAGENQRETDQHACRSFFAKQVVDVVAERADGYEPEYAENQFAVAAAELEPERGPRIFYEPDEEPVRENGHALVEREMGLDPYFDDLVDGQQPDDQQYDFFLGHGFARFPVAKMSHFSETGKFKARPGPRSRFGSTGLSRLGGRHASGPGRLPGCGRVFAWYGAALRARCSGFGVSESLRLPSGRFRFFGLSKESSRKRDILSRPPLSNR